MAHHKGSGGELSMKPNPVKNKISINRVGVADKILNER